VLIRKTTGAIQFKGWHFSCEERVSCNSAAVKRRLHVCCSYGETVIMTGLKSVARIRLVKTDKTLRVLVICKLWKSELAL
jgi:hypothetical protein